jgi:hypothetical protein
MLCLPSSVFEHGRGFETALVHLGSAGSIAQALAAAPSARRFEGAGSTAGSIAESRRG